MFERLPPRGWKWFAESRFGKPDKHKGKPFLENPPVNDNGQTTEMTDDDSGSTVLPDDEDDTLGLPSKVQDVLLELEDLDLDEGTLQ